ncbi:MAG: serine dehydratase, partial [Synergistaceae bacterium]
MRTSSILNSVIGPIMTGCSSSHTAGPYYIAKMFRSIFKGLPKETSFLIEPGSSLSCSYHEQGSDLAMIMGLLDIPFTDSRFKNAFSVFPEYGAKIEFKLESFTEAIHPNSIKIIAKGADGKIITAVADSTGGGSLLFRFINNIKVSITGDKYHIIVSADEVHEKKIQSLL